MVRRLTPFSSHTAKATSATGETLSTPAECCSRQFAGVILAGIRGREPDNVDASLGLRLPTLHGFGRRYRPPRAAPAKTTATVPLVQDSDEQHTIPIGGSGDGAGKECKSDSGCAGEKRKGGRPVDAILVHRHQHSESCH
jgi:hypothetical protein